MSNTIKELHSTVTTHHELLVGGQWLVEEKKNTTITELGTGEKLGEILFHHQQIGPKTIITIIENGSKKEETKMSAEEKKQFFADWKKLWKPTLTQTEVQNAIDS